MHLQDVTVEEGSVRPGEQMGTVGDSGQKCYGVHLHFAVYLKGEHRYVNPLDFVTPPWR